MKTVVLSLALLIHGITYGQNFVWVFLNKKENKEELPAEQVKEIMDGHMANISRLAKEGKLLAAGPFEEGGGIFVFDSHSFAEVNEWLSTDPGIQAKRWDIELFSYTARTGSVCSVGEKYEMTNYYFVRYTTQIVKRVGKVPEARQAHQAYIKPWAESGAVIAEGSLSEEAGSVLVLKEKPSTEELMNDPAVKSGALNADLEKLFIARGSFCEPKP